MANPLLSIKINAVDNFSKSLSTINQSLLKISGDMKKTKSDIAKTLDISSNAQIAKSALTDTKEKLTGFFQPIIQEGVEFEHTMTRLGAIANLDLSNEENLKQFKALETEALRLGQTTAFSAKEAGQAMNFLAMAGMNAEGVIGSMEKTLQLATVGEVDLARAADVASNTMSAFKMEMKTAEQAKKSMTRVSNAMAAAMTGSNVSLEDLAETFKYVAPVANKAGVDIENLAAMAGLLGDIGIQGSQAGTGLRAGLLRMAALPKSAQEELQKMGITTMETAESIKKLADADIDTSNMKVGDLRDMSLILGDIQKSMSGAGSGQVLDSIKKIFGTEASAAFVELVDGANRKEKSISDFAMQIKKGVADDKLQKQFETINSSMQNMLKGMDSAKSKVFITIFKTLQPLLSDVTKYMTGLWMRVDKFIQDNPKLAKTFFMISAAILGIITVLIPIVGAIAALGAAKAGLIVVVKFLGGAFVVLIGIIKSVSVALLTTPFGWVILGIMAVIAVGVLLYKYAGQIKQFFVDLWITIKEVWERIGGFGRALIVGVFAPFLLIPFLIIDNFEYLKEIVIGIFESISGFIMSTIDIAISWINNIKQALLSLYDMLPDSIKSMFSSDMNISGSAGDPIQTAGNVIDKEKEVNNFVEKESAGKSQHELTIKLPAGVNASLDTKKSSPGNMGFVMQGVN